jgi:hypothetical protein
LSKEKEETEEKEGEETNKQPQNSRSIRQNESKREKSPHF